MNTALGTLVKPRPSLVLNGLLSFVIAGIPLFGVLIWMGAVHETLVLAIGGAVLTAFVAVLLVWRYQAVQFSVQDGIVHEVGFSSELTVPVADISRIVIAETDESSSTDTVSQLLALRADGLRAFRMRGLYWTTEDMHAVASAIGAPVEIESTPMSPNEFYSKYAGAAYWFEGRPWLSFLGIALAAVAAYGIVFVLMIIAGNFPPR